MDNISIRGKMKRKIFILLIPMVLLTTSCEYAYIHYEDVDTTDTVSFSADVLPIFRANCTACHDGTLYSPDLTDENAYDELTGNAYVDVDAPEESILMEQLYDNHPAANTLTNTEITTVLVWIEQGALDN